MNETYRETESPLAMSEAKSSPSLPIKAICRERSSWRGQLRALLPFDGALIRCIRIARFIRLLGPWRALAIAFLRCRFRNRTFPRISPTIFPDLDTDAAFKALDRNGFVGGLRLPPTSVAKIRALAAKSEVMEEAHWDCAEIDRIAHDSAIVEVVKRYLGAEPILLGTILFWTFPNKSRKASYPEIFHYDVDDFRSVCVCFYLTDVFADSGPHVAIAGTHKRKSLLRLIDPFMTDEYAARRFGSRVTTFVGEAGTGFFEDRVAQHKRLIGTRPRLALFISYTLSRKPDTLSGTVKVNR